MSCETGREIYESGEGKISRPASILIAFLVLLFLFPLSVPAFDVLALKSSEIKPYNDALAGFRETCGCTVTEHVIRGSSAVSIRDEIREHAPDAILAVGIDAFRIARQEKDLPVFYVLVPPSVIPGGQPNITGVSMSVPLAEQLAMIMKVFPQVKRIGMLGSPGEFDVNRRQILRLTDEKGISIVMKPVYRAGDVPSLLDEMKGKIDLFWMTPDIKVINDETARSQMFFSFVNRIPVFTFAKKYVEMGAVAGVQVIPHDMGRQSGEIARRVFRDTQGDGSVRQQARKTVLMINGKVARKMGLEIHEEILRMAEDVE